MSHISVVDYLKARWLRLSAVVVVGVIVGVLAMSVVVPVVLGESVLYDLTGSMAPALHQGDLVSEQQVSPTSVHVGDVVTFRDPLNHAVLITHRVQAVSVNGDVVAFRTKGDANTTVEDWSAARTTKIGIVRSHIPLVGYAINGLTSAPGRIGLIGIPMIVWAGWGLTKVWRPARRVGVHHA